jgi:phosphatidylglycerophosphatase A
LKLTQPQWTAQLPTQTVLNIATLGPVGMKLKAPGTWGSLAGLLFFVVCFVGIAPIGVLGTVICSMGVGYLAVAFCGEAELRMGKRDPGEIILDEVVAMPLCFLGWQMIVVPTPLAFLGLLVVGFGLFRFFDIRKPWVINSLQDLPGGWGIVLDDTAAALATCATLHVAHLIWVLV